MNGNWLFLLKSYTKHEGNYLQVLIKISENFLSVSMIKLEYLVSQTFSLEVRILLPFSCEAKYLKVEDAEMKKTTVNQN